MANKKLINCDQLQTAVEKVKEYVDTQDATKAGASHKHGNITNDGKLANKSAVVITDANNLITTSTITTTELGYLKDTTGSIQTQINGKAPTSHASTGTGYGVSSASNYGHAKASSTTPKANGEAVAGTETSSFARGDHVHPLQTSVSGSAGSCTGNASTSSKWKNPIDLSWTGDAAGVMTVDGSESVESTLTLAATGVTAGSYGPATDVSPSHKGVFSVPYITVDKKGRITAAATKTITLPADSDVNVTNTLATTTKAYVTGTTTATTHTSGQVFDTGVYLDTTAGMLTATTFKGALSGNASTATTLQTERNFYVSDNDATNTGPATVFNGSANATIKLPATIKATLTGNASSATVWATKRNFSVSDNDATNTGPTIQVDGSGNVALKLPATVKATLNGNASTATKLAATKNINGTAFDGSENITTTQWGAERTLTIGNTGKKVNGSTDYSWSLSEIGALPAAGGTATGDITINKSGARFIATNGTSTIWFGINTSGDKWGIYDSINAKYIVEASNAAASFLGNATTCTTASNVTVTKDEATKLYLAGVSKYEGTNVRASTPYVTGGTITATTFSGALNGNASTATTLQNGRTINGTTFNGSQNITTATWGTARDITIGGTTKSVNGSTTYSWSLNEIGAARGKTASATTAATSQWYRIAASSAGINRNFATFTIDATVSGKHSITQLNAANLYGTNPTLVQLSHTTYGSATGISKARIVYHTTYGSNYAYLEVFIPTATATTLNVHMSDYSGWSLVTPSTVGSIPSGYTSKEITFVNVGMAVAGNVTTESATITGNIQVNNNSSIRSKIKTAQTASDGTTAIAANTTVDILTYNGSDNLHIGGGIYDKGCTVGGTYLSGATLIQLRTISGTIQLKPSGASVLTLDSSKIDAAKVINANGGIVAKSTINPNANGSVNIGSSSNRFAQVVATNVHSYGANGTNYASLRMTTEGTTSAQGVGRLTAGNNINAGTAGNAKGQILLYGTNTGYTTITPGYNDTSNITLTLPSGGGTLARTSDTVAAANKLSALRKISLDGIVSGSANFDGSGDITITASANDITTISKSLTVTTAWMDTGIAGTNLKTGTYAVQMYVNGSGQGGQYTEYYSGIMSWFEGATNSTDTDEIFLHKAGHATGGNSMFLRTVRRESSSTLKLQIACSKAFTAAVSIQFKFKKLI